jgi:hypothetical protein
VIFVLLLWVGAIALFYHQWGKINGLEPYQPDFVHANLTLHNEATPPSENNFAVIMFLDLIYNFALIMFLDGVYNLCFFSCEPLKANVILSFFFNV